MSTENKKVIITTGGTGGHVYPALVVAKKLEKEGFDVVFVGSSTRMEKELVENSGIKFIGINVHPIKNIKKLGSNTKAFYKALKILNKEKPNIIFGFGNYISIPMLLAGMLTRKKIYLQEQNATIGLANKLFYKVAKKCFLAFDLTYEDISIKDQHKFMVTGNPLREEIYTMNKKEEREKLKIGDDEKVLLITGGSLGAKTINDAMLSKIKELYKNKNLRIYWATGESNYDEISEKTKNHQIKMTDIIKPYFNNMINLMAVADLVVCRAGALTISELIQLEKPSILIPYNSIKVGQYQNAKILLEKEGAMLYNNSKAEEAMEKAFELINDEEKLKQMSAKIKTLKNGNAGDKIVEQLKIWRD